MTKMDSVAAVPTVDGGHARSRPWLLAGALGITQTIGYGVLAYAFAVYLAPMARDLHASPSLITGALTVSVLVAAACAVPVGRWLDRHGGRGLMIAGSVLAAAAVVAWSQVTTVLGLYLVLAVVGIASSMVLYEAAFAVVIAVTQPTRRASTILAITIIAGFASSIFLPLTAVLVEHFGWRNALLLQAFLLAAVTIPLHTWVLPRPATVNLSHASVDRAAVRNALRDRGFWLMAVAFTAHNATTTAIAVHLIGYLISLGHPATYAATVTGLLGILSVTGRLTTTGLTRRWPTAVITGVIFLLQAVAVAALPAFGRNDVGTITCVTLFGLGFGVATIAKPVLVAERYGTKRYASIAGALTLPGAIAKATGPLGAAVLIAITHGYRPMLIVVSALCVLAGACLLGLRR